MRVLTFGGGGACKRLNGIILVRKGDIKRVIDVGAGTGLLSMYAAGARSKNSSAVTEVVAVEANTAMAKIATELVSINNDGEERGQYSIHQRHDSDDAESEKDIGYGNFFVKSVN